MADPLRHHSSDVPEFDTYPADPGSAERMLPENASPANYGSPLEDRAAQLGVMIGRATVRIRELRRRIETRVREMNAQTSDALADVTESAESTLGELKEKAQSQAEDWKQIARERVGQARRQVRHNVYLARIRVRELERDRPLEMALGAGAAGLVVGAALRFWRANRA